MKPIVFVSAVSAEFHDLDPAHPGSFTSYRDVVARSLRLLIEDCEVVVQENLAQGLGDLLETLDREVQGSDIVLHLVGDMTGLVPEEASVRRLHERHPNFLDREPELGSSLTGEKEISYTQWEAYLAFHHGKGRLVFRAEETAPRSPRHSEDPAQRESQRQHWRRIQETGEHYGAFRDQRDLARKAVASIERRALRPGADAGPLSEEEMASAREQAPELAHEIGGLLRRAATRPERPDDPARIRVLLAAIDTASLKRELDRRTTLEAVHGYRGELREAVADQPAPPRLYDLAFAELALGNYLDAAEVARRLAGELAQVLPSEPTRLEEVLNAYLLWYEAARLAGRHDEAVTALEEGGRHLDPEAMPVRWASYHETLAEYLIERARYATAEPPLERALSIRKSREAEEPGALIQCLFLSCDLLSVQERHEEVLEHAHRAADLSRQLPPPDRHLRTATAVQYQASAWEGLGKYEPAERLHRLACEIRKSQLGAMDPGVATSMSGLALVLRRTDRLAEAESLYRQAIEIDSKAGIYFDTTLSNLGVVLRETGQYEEAEEIVRRALAMSEARYGAEHPHVATRLGNLARLLRKTNRLDEAETVLRRALRIDEASLGPRHPDVANRLNNLGQALCEAGRLTEAEPLLRRALEIDEERFGPEHPWVARDLHGLGLFFRASGHTEEAVEALRRAVTILGAVRKTSDHHHTDLGEYVRDYADLLRERGLSEKKIEKKVRSAIP